MAERPGFVMYKKHQKILKRLSMQEIGELITALFDYFCDGVRREFDYIPLDIAYTVLTEQMDIDLIKYENKCRKMAKYAEKYKNQFDSTDANSSQMGSIDDSDYNSLQMGSIDGNININKNNNNKI